MSTMATYPIVDIYEAFIKICQLQLCNETPQSEEEVRLGLNAQIRSLNDERVSILLAATGITHDPFIVPETEFIYRALTSYTKGDYSQCITECKNGLSLAPEIFLFSELLAKSAGRQGLKSIELPSCPTLELFLNDLLKVLLKTPDSEKAASNLRKKAYALPSLRTSAQVFSFLMKEYIYDSYNLPSRFIHFGNLNSQYVNPRIATSINSSAKADKFLNYLTTFDPNETIINFYRKNFDSTRFIEQNGSSTEKGRLSLHTGRLKRSEGELEEAASTFRSLLSSDDYLLAQEALLDLNKTLSDLGKLDICIDLLATAYIQNPFLVSRLPIAEITHQIEQTVGTESFSGLISLPILYEVLSSTSGPVYDARRDDAYDDFLRYHEVATPTQLWEKKDKFPQESLIYFLRNVCIPDIMDSSVAFSSTEQLRKERISICQILLTLDPDNTEAYSEEIKYITQKLIVQRGIREVEQSKIHVEVSGIRKAMEKSLRESYTRYIDLLSTSAEEPVEEMIIQIGKALGVAAENLQFLIPGDEILSLFREMFLEMRNQFVSSNEFGLDGYLSTGLRHGTLAGQLRAPFETEFLVTQRDEESKIYREPTYWIEQLAYIPDPYVKRVSESLRTFSRCIDDLIDTARNEWIQIKTELKPSSGLFDYTVSDIQLAEIQSEARRTTSYDEFVDTIFNHLWELTERNLNSVRKHIKEILKPNILQNIDNLEHSITEIKGDFDISVLTDAITRARTDAQYAVDKIENWFRRAQVSDIGPFTLDLPIDIAKAMVENIFPRFSFSSTANIDSSCRLPGKTLTSFSNVLFLLLDNVRKHSSSSNSHVNVGISFIRNGTHLELEIKSELDRETNIHTAREKLRTIVDSVKSESFELVPKEGGSGLHKIRRILVVELDLTPEMQFTISDDYQFMANIEFDATSILS